MLLLDAVVVVAPGVVGVSRSGKSSKDQLKLLNSLNCFNRVLKFSIGSRNLQSRIILRVFCTLIFTSNERKFKTNIKKNYLFINFLP